MKPQVGVTAWPPQEVVTVQIAGDVDGASAMAVADVVRRLDGDLVRTLVLDLAAAALPEGIPSVLVQALRPRGTGAHRYAVINAPNDLSQPSGCTAARLLWHRRDDGPSTWQEALRRARPAGPGSCDCAPAQHGADCTCPALCDRSAESAPPDRTGGRRSHLRDPAWA